MASKLKRRVIGSVCKAKDSTKPDYIKIREDVTLKKDSVLRLESKKSQLAGVETAAEAGKLSPDLVVKIKERIEKIPEWVRFEIVQLSEAE